MRPSEKESLASSFSCPICVSCCHVEIDYPENSFDLVVSMLAVTTSNLCCYLRKDEQQPYGRWFLFVFLVDNPIFRLPELADGNTTKWDILHWPVDNYFAEGKIRSKFCCHDITKYHKTFATNINTLGRYGFNIIERRVPKPGGAPYEVRHSVKMMISAKNVSSKSSYIP